MPMAIAFRKVMCFGATTRIRVSGNPTKIASPATVPRISVSPNDIERLLHDRN